MTKANNTPAKRQNREDTEQIALVEWASWYKFNGGKLSDYLHHSPNGGSRNIVEATKFKRMGVLAGFPDLFLFVARGGYHGLFIELKAKGGRVSKAQADMIARLQKAGYLCCVCFGANSAIETIKAYLELIAIANKHKRLSCTTTTL